jgi:transporter family-2 protein
MLILLLLGYGGEKFSISNIIHASNCLWVIGLMGVGILGAGVLGSAIVYLPKAGAAAYVAFLVAGQLIFAMLFDQTGAFGLAKFPITPLRALGGFFLLLGARFIMWR